MNNSISNKSIYISYIIWWGTWILVQAFVINHLGWPYAVAFVDSLVSNITLAAVGLAIFNTLRFYQPQKENYAFLRLMVLLVSLFAAVIINWLVKLTTYDNVEYQIKLAETFPIRFCYTFLMVSFISLLNWVWYYFKSEQEREERKNTTEKMAKETELASIRQQLQPHFLFNSLNSISALVGTRPQEARKMIQQLSDFLRGTLRKENNQKITLKEEIEHLELYLDIEKVRFGHRLKTEVVFDKSCDADTLPSLLLQPVVENAIKFGLYDTVGEITIRIEASRTDKMLMVVITNPFDAQTARPPQGTGYGLTSIQRRLYLLYARNDLLLTERRDNLFITSIKIPQYD